MNFRDMAKTGSQMSSNRQKGADEVFCRSCGETIKKEAEVCPHCGVRNKEANSSSGRASASSTTHDPSQYETSVSDTWWYGVAGGVGLWVLAILASGIGGPLDTLGGFLALAAWIGMPVAAYFDMQYIRANGRWNPNTVVWVVLLLVWFINIVAGVVYLYRRHEVLGEP